MKNRKKNQVAPTSKYSYCSWAVGWLVINWKKPHTVVSLLFDDLWLDCNPGDSLSESFWGTASNRRGASICMIFFGGWVWAIIKYILVKGYCWSGGSDILVKDFSAYPMYGRYKNLGPLKFFSQICILNM